MTPDTARELAALAAILTGRRMEEKGSEGWRAEMAADDAFKLYRLARRLHNRALYSCNIGYRDDAAQARADKADERDYAAATEIAEPYGATIGRMSDVRGHALRLLFGADGPGNGWSEGWGVSGR
jgi:hypothetical protein